MYMGETSIQAAVDGYKGIFMPYRNFAERTRSEYAHDLQDFARFLQANGIERVAELRLPGVQRYAANLEERGFASQTRKRRMVTVRSFLSFLFQSGLLDHDLAKQVVLPFAESGSPHVLMPLECERLRQVSAGDLRDLAMVELLLQTGLRLSELQALTTDDLVLVTSRSDGGAVRIRGVRGRKDRILTLDRRAGTAVQTILEGPASHGGEALFLNRFGDPLGARGMQKRIHKRILQARIGLASIHTLRHTFAARCAERGESLKDLQAVLGHRDRRSTSIYASFVKSKQAR